MTKLCKERFGTDNISLDKCFYEVLDSIGEHLQKFRGFIILDLSGK